MNEQPGRLARAWRLLRLAEYDTIQVFAACAITALLTYFVTQAT